MTMMQHQLHHSVVHFVIIQSFTSSFSRSHRHRHSGIVIVIQSFTSSSFSRSHRRRSFKSFTSSVSSSSSVCVCCFICTRYSRFALLTLQCTKGCSQKFICGVLLSLQFLSLLPLFTAVSKRFLRSTERFA